MIEAWLSHVPVHVYVELVSGSDIALMEIKIPESGLVLSIVSAKRSLNSRCASGYRGAIEY